VTMERSLGKEKVLSFGPQIDPQRDGCDGWTSTGIIVHMHHHVVADLRPMTVSNRGPEQREPTGRRPTQAIPLTNPLCSDAFAFPARLTRP
jgi:hypothetical protein